MKRLFSVLPVAMSISLADAANLQPDLAQVLARPLIIGASVSGDYLTPSPGKRAALRYTTLEKIDVLAGNGRRGYDSLRLLKSAKIQDRTAILGVDTFFWDAMAPSPEASVRAIDELVGIARQRGVPLILGDVPVVMPSRQKSVAAVNAALSRACTSYPRCRIVGLNALFQQVARDGYFDYKGVRYPIEELVPDGLHIGAPASEYLSDEVERLLSEIP